MCYKGSVDGTEMSMMDAMADGLSRVGRTAFMIISPFIGILGSFVSGSNTVSDTLFTALQYQTAENLALPTVFAVAMQIIGGAVGNITCINNAVAACATIGTIGREGKLIKINIPLMFIYTIIVIAVFAVLLAIGYQPV